MLEKPRRRMSVRARQVIGIATGAAVAAAAVTAVTLLPSAASAEETPVPLLISNGYGKLPPIPQDSETRSAGPKKLPPGARRATTGAEKPGAKAKRFETPATRTRVVGGTLASPADFPGVVGIRTHFPYQGQWYYSTCTGSVLSSTRVLTAAHCTVDAPFGYTEVIAGRATLSNTSNGFVARVSHAWTHQGYNLEAMYNDPEQHPIDDVTVLTLKDALPSAYTPVTLADQGAPDPAEGTDAKIVGYGVTTDDPEAPDDSGILREATVDIASDATCATPAQYGSRFDPNRMLCAGNPPTTDTCYGDSGGPIFTGAANARVQVGITDWGDGCASKLGVYEAINHYSNVIKAQITLTPANNLDWTGDGHSDLMLRDPSGDLQLGSGSGLVFGTPQPGPDFVDIGFSDFGLIGEGWGSYSKLFRVNNWAGDGTPSVFARDSAGRLFNYRSDGRGAFRSGAPLQIGSGWNAFTDIMVTNDWIGNGLPNLMGRTADGRLVIYNSDGKGGWSNPKGTQIGTGWTKFNTVLTPGSWMGDGRQSLVGRTPAGELWLYNSDGNGGWTNPKGTKIGTGWGGFTTFMSPGDFNGDNLVDLLGVRSNGNLMLYTTNGKGSWLNGNGRQLAYGWQHFTIF